MSDKCQLSQRIIVIEDSEFSRLLITSKLKKFGYTNIDQPPGAIEAWEMIADAFVSGTPYDLVITDLNMPGLDGIELIEKIKEDELSKNQKVIVGFRRMFQWQFLS